MSTTNPTVRKTTCAVTRGEFLAHAKPISVRLGETDILQAATKQFSTNSLGWYTNGKITVYVNGKAVQVQVGITLTAIGSKELPHEAPAAPAAPAA